MKKILFSLVLLLSAVAAMADTGTLVMRTPKEYQVMFISANGQWATGVYYDYSYNPYAFRWSLESGEIEMLSSMSTSIPSGISNDGTVIGNYAATDVTSNGAEVDAPGYYRDGAWHTLPMPGKYSEGFDMFGSVMGAGISGGISPDGVWMTGSCYVDGALHPVIWKNGEIYKDLYCGSDCVPYCISPDGQTIGGWTYIPEDNGTRYTFLQGVADAKPTIFSKIGVPWNATKQITSDGKLALMWNWWTNETDTEGKAQMNAIYNIETQEFMPISTIDKNPVNFDMFAMSDNGVILGMEQDITERAIIIKDGETHFVTDYFKQQGIHDFEADPFVLKDPEVCDYPVVERGVGISADGKIMAFFHYEPEGYHQTTVLMLDQEVTHRAPCGLKVKAMPGEQKIRVAWKAPLANAENVAKYIVYRDGVKVAEVPASQTMCFDRDLALGEYTYTVTAVYSDAVESDVCKSAQCSVLDAELQGAYDVYARQRGMQGASITWHAPHTNHIVKTYYDDANDEIIGFGGGDRSFEVAIRIAKEEAAEYKGKLVKAVEFYPMTSQLGWTVTLYEMAADSSLKVLKQQKITQPLTYGQLNKVVFDEPYYIEEMQGDLIVAVAPKVSTITASYNVIGMVEGGSEHGYGDLLRQLPDNGEEADNLVSLYDLAQENANTQEATWAINLVIENDKLQANADEVANYVVYVDGEQIASVEDNKAEVPTLTEGNHVITVETVYANGDKAPMAEGSITISINDVMYSVEDFDIEIAEGSSDVKLKWEAPVDNDEHIISYSGEVRSSQYEVKGNETENYALQARSVYQQKVLRGYAGMQIKRFRFFPTCDALFTFILTCNGEEIVYQEVEDYQLRAWNEVELEEPVTLLEGLDYELTIDCYDATPDRAPLGVDTHTPFEGISNLVATNGENFSTLTEVAVSANWMMGLVVENPEPLPLDILGYNVQIDGKTVNSSLLTDTEYTCTVDGEQGSRHTVAIATQYNGQTSAFRGTRKTFYLGIPTAIDEVKAADKRAFYYDMVGRRLINPAKGTLVIKNGKKMVADK